MKKTIFISGHSDVDVKEFSNLYAHLIKNAIDEGCYFVLGDCDGVDALAQIFLFKTLPEEEHSRVKIFFRGNQPKNFFSKGFMAVGGFYTHEEAAVAMTLCSDEDIAYVHSGRETSLAGKNIIRRFTKGFPYDEWMNKKKSSNTEFWNILKENLKEEIKDQA